MLLRRCFYSKESIFPMSKIKKSLSDLYYLQFFCAFSAFLHVLLFAFLAFITQISLFREFFTSGFPVLDRRSRIPTFVTHTDTCTSMS
jgi:hypothetical protein